MRIGQWELRSIRDRILRDLYEKPESDLTARKIRIAQQNREFFIEPLMSTLSALPDEMISHNNEYILKINYGNDPEENKRVKENWVYRSDKPIINPRRLDGNTYNSSPEQELDKRLYEDAEILCKDILHLRAMKKEQSDYLVQTMDRESGSLQLRKTWPEYLHKYLPPEPVKVPRKTKGTGTKKVEEDKPVVPDSFQTRLTENLLEGV